PSPGSARSSALLEHVRFAQARRAQHHDGRAVARLERVLEARERRAGGHEARGVSVYGAELEVELAEVDDQRARLEAQRQAAQRRVAVVAEERLDGVGVDRVELVGARGAQLALALEAVRELLGRLGLEVEDELEQARADRAGAGAGAAGV